MIKSNAFSSIEVVGVGNNGYDVTDVFVIDIEAVYKWNEIRRSIC